jgi:hypothetical protein
MFMGKEALLAGVTSVLMVLSAGCGKHAADSPAQTSGQTFNAVQYYQDFASASPELKTLADKAWTSIQSGAFPYALKYLSQLGANPALNDAQKKSVAGLTEQVKKQMTAGTAAR